MSNARTKRLNESQEPVKNYGVADAQHKLVLPQNTTANLAQIPNLELGALAYDTALHEVVVNTGSGFTAVAAGGAVSNIATGTGLTGGPITSTGTISIANTAVTPGAYTSANITVDQQGRITLAANGSGGGSSRSGIQYSSSDMTVNPATDLFIIADTDTRAGTVNVTLPAAGVGINGFDVYIRNPGLNGNSINVIAPGASMSGDPFYTGSIGRGQTSHIVYDQATTSWFLLSLG